MSGKIRDFRVDTKASRQRMLPIYGRTAHCYQMDTLVQSKDAINSKKNYATTPPYYLMLININSRKGYAYPMTMKNATHVSHALLQFLHGHRMTHLYTDDDKAYTHRDVAELLIKHKVEHTKTVKENKHVLGIINRFMRTIRDKNGFGRDIDKAQMEKLIAKYNNTVHSTTGCKPNDWTDAKNEEWIELKHREMIAKQGAEEYQIGKTYVRVPKERSVFEKVRSRFLPDRYLVTGIDGNRYQVLQDGKVVTYSAFQLRKAVGNEKANDANNPAQVADNVVTQILGYDHTSKQYLCKWEDGEVRNTTIRSLRGTAPNRLNVLERDYWRDKPSDTIPFEIKQLMPKYVKLRKQRVKLVYHPKEEEPVHKNKIRIIY